jgi:hypothetical protein
MESSAHAIRHPLAFHCKARIEIALMRMRRKIEPVPLPIMKEWRSLQIVANAISRKITHILSPPSQKSRQK